MKSFSEAKWIWHNSYRGTNVYVNFEDEFTLGDAPSACSIKISCDRNYALYINGGFVDSGQYSDYEDLKYYDELDITPHVKPGKNTLLAVVYYQGVSCSTYRRGEPGLIFEVSADGEVVCASSERTVAYKNSAFADGDQIEWVSGQLGIGFHYDATREGERTGEKPADIVEKTMDIRPRPIEKLTVDPHAKASIINKGVFFDTAAGTPAQKMQAAALATQYLCGGEGLPSDEGVALSKEPTAAGPEPDGVFAIVDLGEENTGFISLDIDVPCDCDIYIGWGEHLADLRVRSFVGGRNFAVKYRARAGRNRFENPLFRCGLRYLQLHIYAERCTIYYAGIRPTLYPLPEPAKPPVDDYLHRKIYEVSCRTLLLCMHEHYEDCPWREQALYTMDSRNQMLCGYYAYGETKFPRASLELMAHSIRDDNMLELCSPAEVAITIPSFSAIFMVQLQEYLDFSEDTDFAMQTLPVAERNAGEFIRRAENEGGLIKCFGEQKYWNFYEWQSGLAGTIGGFVPEEERTYDAPLNAFVSLGLRSLSKICGKLGLAEKEKYYRDMHEKLNQAIDAAFFDDDRGCYASFLRDGKKWHYSELTNSLVVCAGAVPDERLESVLAALAGGQLLTVTLSHSIFKYDALMQNREKYAQFVLDSIAELWGKMLYSGATSFWETIDGESAFANAGSLCHGWSAIPIYIYFKYFGG